MVGGETTNCPNTANADQSDADGDGVGDACDEIAVADAVKSIIEEKCAGCHVALPAGHTGTRDVDQCGLCHIPYGDTTAPAHGADTAACTACHATPEVTHFFLRDDEVTTITDWVDDSFGGRALSGRKLTNSSEDESVCGRLRRKGVRMILARRSGGVRGCGGWCSGFAP